MTPAAPASADRLAKAFVVIAVVEAVTWTALLIGMYFKYVPESTEAGVQIAGPIHGTAFLAYLGVTWFTADALDWSGKVTAAALLAGIPPYGSVLFERWAARHGLLESSQAPS